MSFKEGQQFSLKQIDQPFKSGIDFTKLSSEGLKKLWKQTLDNVMPCLLKNYTNVSYEDFSEVELNYEQDFNDLTHLSKNGMKKFTNLFVNYYNSIH